jgi:hypothetical protein
MAISPEIVNANGVLLVFGPNSTSFPQRPLPPGGIWSGIYYSDQCHRLLSAGSYTAWLKPIGIDNKTNDSSPNADKSTPVTVL